MREGEEVSGRPVAWACAANLIAGPSLRPGKEETGLQRLDLHCSLGGL